MTQVTSQYSKSKHNHHGTQIQPISVLILLNHTYLNCNKSIHQFLEEKTFTLKFKEFIYKQK